MQIANEHIQAWLKSGKAQLVPINIASEFDAHLRVLPWNVSGSGLDWTQIGNTRANLAELSAIQLVEWLHATAFKDDSHLVFWFGPNEPCIACESHSAILEIDHAFWKMPGRCYLFGAKLDGVLHPEFAHIAEYDGADLLIAMQ